MSWTFFFHLCIHFSFKVVVFVAVYPSNDHSASPRLLFFSLLVCRSLVPPHLSAWTWLRMDDKWVMGWNHMKQMGINHIALSRPALMKRDANAPDSARLLHPPPAEEIFKDPPWVTYPLLLFKFPIAAFAGAGSRKQVLKMFSWWPAKGQLLQRSSGKSALLVRGFVTFIAPCCAVRMLCKCDAGRMFKSRCD